MTEPKKCPGCGGPLTADGKCAQAVEAVDLIEAGMSERLATIPSFPIICDTFACDKIATCAGGLRATFVGGGMTPEQANELIGVNLLECAAVVLSFTHTVEQARALIEEKFFKTFADALAQNVLEAAGKKPTVAETGHA